MPRAMQKIVRLFPLTQGISLMKNTFVRMNPGNVLAPICVMLGLTALCVGLALSLIHI